MNTTELGGAATDATTPELIRVLVVDDLAMFGEVLASAIDGEGDLHLVAAVNDLEAAAAVIEHGIIDVVVLDMELNNGAGIDLLQHWKALRPSVAFVLLTSRVRNETVVGAIASGAEAVVSKNRSADDLLDAVRSAHNGRISIVIETEAVDDDEFDPGLTEREIEILRLLGDGRSDLAIAEFLNISRNTVRTHVQRAYSKLGVSSRVEAIAVARRIRAI